MSFNFIPTAFFNSLAVKSTDFLKLSYMEKVKVREQEKGGENDIIKYFKNKNTSLNISKWLDI